MNYEDAIKAIKEARIVFAYVKFTNDDGYNVSIPKKVAIDIITRLHWNDHIEFNVTSTLHRHETKPTVYIG